MGQQKGEGSLLDRYADAVVAELMFLQRDLPWGAGYNAVAKSIPTPLEQADPVSFLTVKTLPPFKLPIQEGFKIIDGKLQGAAIIILFPSNEGHYQRKLIEITKKKLDSKYGMLSKKTMDTPQILGYAWLTKQFLVGLSIGQTDDPAVKKGKISPFGLSIELIHRIYAPAAVAEFERRIKMGTLESERSKTLDETGFPLKDANQLIQTIKYGDSTTNIRKYFVHFDVTVDNEMGIAASGFRHLDQPAAVEIWYHNGLVARKGIHLLYALTDIKPQTAMQKAIKDITKIYGQPISKSDRASLWLYGMVLITVVHNSEGKMVTIVFAHRDFDPQTNQFLKSVGR